jgi:hypothetical protein
MKVIKQLYEKNTGEDIMPVTHTQAVRTPNGMTAEQVHTHFENALQGKGSDGSAQIYPQLFLDNFTTLSAANEALNDIFVSTNWKYQGRIRANVLGQALVIEQYALNANRGYWMQVAYGVFAPSSDGSSLVQEQSKPHISYRFRNSATPVGTWRELLVEGLPLKTINNVSLVGIGNIEIGQGGSTVTVDTAMDESSENPVQNKVVKGYIDGLFENFTPSGGGQGDVIVCHPWAPTDPNPSGCEEGDYCFNTSTPVKLKKLVSGSWVEQTISTQAVYVDSGTRYIYVWNGTSMVQLLSQPPATSINPSSPTYETICVTAKAVADYVAAQIGAIPTASSTVAGLMPSYYVDIMNTFFLEGLTMADKGSIPTVDSLTELPDNPSNLQYGVSYDSGTGAYTLKYYLEDLEGHGAWETSSLPALVEMDGSVYLFRAGEDPVELGGSGAVDTSLSTSSTRPVQNNVLTAAIKDARNSIIVPKYWGGNVEQSGVTFLQGDFWYDGNGTLKQRDALGGWDINYVDAGTPLFIQNPSTKKIYLLIKGYGHYDVFDYFGKKVRFIEWKSISLDDSPAEGTYRYDTSEDKLYVRKNSAWVLVGLEEDVLYVDAGNGRIHVRHKNSRNETWLDDLLPALNERVVVIKYWNDNLESSSLLSSAVEGEYGYNTSTQVLSKYLSDLNEFVEVALSPMSLYVDAKHNSLYRWDFDEEEMVALSSGGGGDKETLDFLLMTVAGIADDVPEYSSAPANPEIDDVYYDTTLLKARKCTQKGTPAQIVISLNGGWNKNAKPADFSSTTMEKVINPIQFAEGDTITFPLIEGSSYNIEGGQDMDYLKDILVAALVASGYEEVDYDTDLEEEGVRLPGKFYVDQVTTSKEKKDGTTLTWDPSYQFTINTKKAWSGGENGMGLYVIPNVTGYRQTEDYDASSSGNNKTLYIETSQMMFTVEKLTFGTDDVWVDAESTGLTSRVAALESLGTNAEEQLQAALSGVETAIQQLNELIDNIPTRSYVDNEVKSKVNSGNDLPDEGENGACFLLFDGTTAKPYWRYGGTWYDATGTEYEEE